MLDYFGSVIIIHDGQNYLLQRKTPGYSIERYVGLVGLIGGGWTKAADRSPRDTLYRELDEEIGNPTLRQTLKYNARFLAAIDVQLPNLLPEQGGAHVRHFVYSARVKEPLTLERVHLREGEAVILPMEKLSHQNIFWGHNFSLHHHLTQIGRLDLSPPPEADASFETFTLREPKAYVEMDLHLLKHCPAVRAQNLDPLRLAD